MDTSKPVHKDTILRGYNFAQLHLCAGKTYCERLRAPPSLWLPKGTEIGRMPSEAAFPASDTVCCCHSASRQNLDNGSDNA